MKNELKKIYDQLNQIKNDQGESLKIIEGLLTNFHTDKKKKALDGWLFIEEVKEILGISTSTIYRYMENGTLSCSRFGSRLIFKISDINAIIDRNYKRFHLPNSKNESDFDDEDFEGDLEILD